MENSVSNATPGRLGYIYSYRNIITNKYYVGQTVQTLKRRMTQHLSAANRGVTQPFYKAIRKHGIENFEFEVVVADVPETLLDDLEINIIHMYEAYTKGYNASTGGSVNRGFKLSEKVKENLIRINTGKKASNETKRLMSIAQTGRKHSEETRKKISASNIGNFHTEETKRKMSEKAMPTAQRQALKDAWSKDTEGNRHRRERLKTLNLGRVQSEEELLSRSINRPRGKDRVNAKAVMCVETGIIYETVTAAAAAYNSSTSNISGACNGKYKKTKGVSFVYVKAAIENCYVIEG